MRVALLFLCACSAPENSFPPGFLFGTATAGFQVDMGCPTLPREVCDDTHSDWYEFVTRPEITGDKATLVKGDAPQLGPGHWELFAQDFDLAKDALGNNAYRMSIEWSRIFPTDSGIPDENAVAHYHEVFAALKARGLTPFVTLNHYTLPTWIHDTVGCHQNVATCTRRGWLDQERTVAEITKFAAFCAQEFGEEVDLWATENESFTSVAVAGYLFQTPIRSNPPAVALKINEAKQVYRALVEAHARMYDAVKANDKKASVGLVYPMIPMRAKDPRNEVDVTSADNIFYLWNMVFLNAVALGKFDANLDGNTIEREDLKGRLDFLGINYYGSVAIEGTKSPILPTLSPYTTFNPLNFTNENNDPRGIYEVIMIAKNDLHVPVYISENGREDRTDDGLTSPYLVRHLQWITRAIKDGADVRGYFYWSLIDNYEWHLGIDFHMGLFAVDSADPMKPRTPRQAVPIYRRIAQARAIPQDLIDLYPEPR